MKRVDLPKSFQPSPRIDVMRLGKAHDGGYVVCRSAIKKSACLLSLGVNDDWSFEEDYQKHENKPVFSFDGSISAKLFKTRFYKSLLSGYQLKNSFRLLKTWMSFRKFTNSTTFHKLFVGISNFSGFISFEDALSRLKFSEDIFLKIDIEGYEYRILEEIIRNKSQFIGAAIEFHDVDLHLDVIKDFVQAFGQEVISINVNNHTPVTHSGLPLTIEICFSRVCVVSEGPNWSCLVQPNDPSQYKHEVFFERE